MANPDQDETDRAGVHLTGLRTTIELNYIFRAQETSDYGVDGHVEIKDDEGPTGRLVGVQIKTGSSYFSDERDDGWIFRPKDRHIRYWLAHSLPMFLLLVDLAAKEIYWQVLDESTILTGDRGGRYVLVPRTHTFSTVSEYWKQSASEIGRHSQERYAENLSHLPPSVARKLEQRESSSPIAAAWLASYLAQSRTAPALAVQTLLTNQPRWLQELESDGWLAVGNYATYHGLGPQAAQAYDLARGLEPARSGQLNFSAGVAVLDEDTERAAQYFADAKESDDFAQLGWLGMELIRLRAGDGQPSALALITQLEAAPEQAAILMFRADRSAAAGDLDDAIALLERALAVDPDNDRILTALAAELFKRAQTSSRRSDDTVRATGLATAAVEQLHRCAGPSVHALKVLLHMLLTQHNFPEVLNRALLPPAGQATPEEATSPEVITTVALAADELGLEDLVDQLLDELTDSVQRDFLRASLARSDRLPDEERKQTWEKIVDNLDTAHPRELVVGITRLARFGIDRTVDLEALVRAHVIPTETIDLIKAIAAAATDPETGLSALRALADNDQTAAQCLIQVLSDAGRRDEAIDVAAEASRRLREPRFSLMQAEMLLHNDSHIKARQIIESALVNPSLSDSMRPDTHAMLARVAARSQEWDQIEQHCEAALRNGAPATRSRFLAWLLVESQVRQRAHIRAIETLEKLQLEPETSEEVRVWAAAVTSRPLDVAVATKFLDLAESFADDVDLSCDLLTAVISRSRDAGQDGQAGPYDERAELPDVIRRRAFASIDAHADAHGSTSRIQRIRFDSVDEFVGLLQKQLEPEQQTLGEIADQVLQGKLPLGILASAARRSVAYVLATRLLGLYIASSFLETDCANDDAGVKAALGGDVVVDTSALMVASLISDFSSLRGHFKGLVMPQACVNDMEVGRGEMDGLAASSGHLGWDAHSGRPTYAAPDIDHQLDSIRRLKLLLSALPHVLPMPVEDLPTFSDFVGTDGRETAWLAPIELAKSRNLVLWSDDVAIRNLARSVGVQAFGTVSLLEHLATTTINAIADGDEESIELSLASRREEMARALAARVVDVPIEIDHLIDEATKANFPIHLAQCTVGRAAWWEWSPSRYQDIGRLLAAINDPATAEIWRTIAMDGAGLLGTWNPTYAGGLVVLTAIAGRGPSPEPSEVTASIITGEQIAARHEAASPAAIFPQVALALEQLGSIDNASALIEAVAAAGQETDQR